MRLAAIGECMVEATLDRAGPFAGPAKLGFGGDTLNTAVYARRCLPEGEGRVAYITALGDDVFSDSMLAAWRDEGLETDLVYRLPGRRPGFYAIATDEAGERRFYYWRREAAVRSLLEDDRERDLAARLKGYDLLYLSGITLAILGERGRDRLLALLQGLRGAGSRVAFDGNHRPALWPEPAAAQAAYQAIGRLTDIALPTLDDEAALHGDESVDASAARWLGWGAREVAIKCGADGCTVVTPEDRVAVPGRPVETVVDTTAAGDSFNGAYLAARLLGETPAQAAIRGCNLAAEVIQHQGAIIPGGRH
ncbi:MAG: sugar kinase [Kiloniellales bacterium]|nr:sugar kinase [Kiloniellales bacterium]